MARTLSALMLAICSVGMATLQIAVLLPPEWGTRPSVIGLTATILGAIAFGLTAPAPDDDENPELD